MFTLKFYRKYSDLKHLSTQQFVSCRAFSIDEFKDKYEITTYPDNSVKGGSVYCVGHDQISDYEECFIENGAGKTIHCLKI